ncbi:MAG: sensor histidine kinase [Pirellulaceae bacterium]
MFEHLFSRLGHHYIAAIMVATRISGSLGGALVVYYVNLTLTLNEPLRTHFFVSATVVVVLAVLFSVAIAMWETRHLRTVLGMLDRGEKPDAELSARAGREAVVFPVRQHLHEAWLVPCSTLLPVVILLRLLDNASAAVLGNIALAVFMGIGLALMTTFFLIERLMQPVVRHLLDQGISINFDRLPMNRLRHRLNLSFGLIILITALMIGTMANQRAADIIRQPNNRDQAVASLRVHTTYITLAAIVVGLVFSTTISQSVASRVAGLVQAMKRVEGGLFTEELRPTGNDEIDVLTRQFNTMVQQLAQNDATIRDLNTNLERKVEDRTLTLRLLHAELDERNTDLESALAAVQQMQSQLVEVAHRAGMTEIAAGVLHNVGNVLNSVNVSVALVAETLRRSKVSGVASAGTMLKNYVAGLGRDCDSKLAKLSDYLVLLGESLQSEQESWGTEISNLTEKIQHIKNIINAQQNYTRRVSFKETIDVHSLLNDLLAMHAPRIANQRIELVRDFGPLPEITIEKSKLLQILDNLIKNAVEAMTDSSGPKTLRITTCQEGDRLVVSVADSGQGISETQLKKIFQFGFTTKKDGHGFGLHSSAIAMSEMGGTIRVLSPGQGKGATFIISVPLTVAPAASDGPRSKQLAVLA